ncbi:MAG: MgtC/SapB family protein [Oscillospiraceae bacterium]|jgi:putative Mg2+ transporter-C (MgtC) family protein|nr:MgtC/SapB family protein [Oscillospiraceae bacterium]
MDAWPPFDVPNTLLRIVVAVFASGVIGFEREYHNRPAGLRTHILVGLGAAMVALMESFNVRQIAAMQTSAVSLSMGRMTAQVISGIGFLGAGTILVHRHSITGLTTAASLWNAACLGIAAGYGYLAICLLGAGSTLLVLTLIRRMLPLKEERRIEISCGGAEQLGCGGAAESVKRLVEQYRLRVNSVNLTAARSGESIIRTYTYSLDFPTGFDFTGFFERILETPDIVSVKMLDD